MTVFERWAPRFIGGLVFAVPLLFWLGLADTFDLPKLSLVYLCDLILVCLWLWQASARGSLNIRKSALDLPLLVFLVVGILSTIHSLDRSLSVWGSYRTYIFGWVPMTSFALLYWLTVQAATPKLMRQVFWAALFSAACAGTYALMQYVGLEIFSEMPAAQGGRAWSSLGNPLYVGALCMMAMALSLTRWSAGRLMAMTLAALGLLNSLSRSAWLGSAAAAGVIVIVFRHRLRANGSKILAGLVMTALLAVFVPGVSSRLKVIASTRESSNAARIEGWKGGLQIWESFPWLGSGPDTFFQAFRPHRSLAYIQATGAETTQAHAHNDMIQMAATEGALGLAAYLGLLVIVIKRGKRAAVLSSMEDLGFFCALLALWVQNQFNFSSVATCAWAAVFAGLLFASESKLFRYPFPRSGAPAFRCGILALLAAGSWAIAIPVRADWHSKQGLAWSQGGNYQAALQHFRQAARLNGHVEIYQTEKANAARSSGLWDEAWQTAQSITARHPQDPDAWNNQGVAAMWMIQLAGRDEWQAAENSFTQAVRLDPVFVDAWANLAKWNHLKGRPDDEKRLWQKVLSLDPRHAMARQVLGVQ